MKRTLKQLERDIQNAPDYHTYREACIAHDELSGMDEWKDDDHSKHYDYRLIRRRINSLRLARKQGNVKELMSILHQGIHGNLGNIAHFRLHSKAKFGTKKLIHEFLNTVCGALDDIYRAPLSDVGFYDKLSFFEDTTHAYGGSCLMLSGGAGLGFFHCGVVKSLLENGLLPPVISGSSAGSLVASLTAIHTDDELKDVLTAEFIIDKLARWHQFNSLTALRQRSLLDPTPLENALIEMFDTMTFEEAFLKTGRHVNVTVSPADVHQHSRMLNARTSPNAIIAMAIRASCAVPFLFCPVELRAKSASGQIRPYIPDRKFADGSIMADMPINRLARLYGINHSIVSQTNPLAVPFLSRNRREPQGWFATSKRHLTNLAKLNTIYACEVLEEMIPHRTTRLGIHKVRSVIEQQYVGDINILPPRNAANLTRILANPNANFIRKQIETAERSTWPVLEMVKNTTQIGYAFQRYLKLLRQQEAEIFLPLSGRPAPASNILPLSPKMP